MPNSTQANEIIRLTAKIADHEKRIASLESSLSALADRIAGFDYAGFTQSDICSNVSFGEDDIQPLKPVPVVLRRGRRPRISLEEFARRRDDLVVFIEVRWPWLVDVFARRESMENILQALTIASPGGEDTWQYRKLKNHIAQLWEFLNSGRYRGEPRNIAYAMAALPELTWRSSLDWGMKNPSPLHIFPAAFADHIRRHNPACWSVLGSHGVTPEALKLLKTCCDECKRWATRPERVRRAFVEGKMT